MIKTYAALRKVVASASGNLFVRWSRGPAKDRNQRVSRDYAAGTAHAGLSAVGINAEWATDDVRLARRMTEYWFLRMKDAQIKCHIYRATRIGADSDGYDLIVDIEHVGTLSEPLINELMAAKEVK